jgi:protein-disulfide isomerase
MEEGQLLDLDAVPTVFVGQYRMGGTITAEELERLITLIQ